ncbi:Gfo/Idh/MocA family protein [Candidatus Poribacteria bacterium]
MENTLSVGLIGCGQISGAHCSGFEKASNTDLVVVTDTDETAARELGEKYDIPYTTSLDEVLSRDDIDIISIATPHYLHAPMAIAAAEAGKHVMVEKPMCTTMEDADRIIAACEDNGVKMTMWFPSRYSGTAHRTKELLRQGVIGRIMYVKITDMGYKESNYWERGVGGRARLSDWRRYVKTAGGGILIMNTVHNIDRLRYVLGYEATSIYARRGTFGSASEVEDFISVSIGYDNGAIGYIESSSWAVGRSSDASRIFGTEGQIILNPLQVYLNRQIGDYPQGAWFEPEIGEVREGRAALAEDFVNAILSDTEPPITGEDGKKALEIILGAYESARVDMPIDLPL